MTEGGGIPANRQEVIADGAGALAIAAAAYANVTVYQYVTRSGDSAAPALKGTSECPYPGLETFRSSEAKYFAGRDEKTAELAAALDRHGMAGSIAASGAGKSSLVHAGLIPALAARENERWDVFAFRPGQDPLYGLARSMSGVLANGDNLDAQLNEIRRNIENLRMTPGRLAEYVGEITQRRSATSAGRHHHVLFFADQWEELYTQVRDPEDRKVLLRELLDVTGKGLAKLLLTMRADFMPDLLSDDGEFFDRLEPGICYLGPMSETERRQAIEKPARVASLHVPEALVTRLVADTGDSEGSLAYLQFVLRKLWEERDKSTNSLTTEAYDRMKGLKGAIGAHASRVFNDLTPRERLLAEGIIPRLVNVSETGDSTSRRLPFSDFGDNARDLLRKLAEPDKRLIVLSAATDDARDSEIVAEVAHEALLREWKELKGWIADRGAFFRLRSKLEEQAKTWVENDRSAEFLIPAGKPLVNAQDLVRTAKPGDLNAELTDFVVQSNKKREADEAASLQAEANQLRRLTLRNRWLMGLAAVFFLSTIGMIYYWKESEVNLLRAENDLSSALVALAEARMNERDYQAAAKLVLAAYYGNPRISATDGWLRVARRVSASISSRAVATGAGSGPLFPVGRDNVSFIDKGRKLVSTSWANKLELLDLASDKTISSISGDFSFARYISGRDEIAALNGDVLSFRNPKNLDVIYEISIPNSVDNFDVCNEGQTLIFITGRDKVVSLDIRSQKKLLERALSSTVTQIRCSQRSKFIAVGGERSLFILEGETLFPLVEKVFDDFERNDKGERNFNPFEITSLAWNDREDLVALGGSDQKIRIVNTHGAELFTLKGHGENISNISLNTDRARLEAQKDSIIGDLFAKFGQKVSDVKFTKSGRFLLSAGSDFTLRAWNLESRSESFRLEGHGDSLTSVDFSNETLLAASASLDESIRIWNFSPIFDGSIIGSLCSHITNDDITDFSVYFETKLSPICKGVPADVLVEGLKL